MKKITTVLFDLDGTLIRMDQDEFVRLYFESLISRLTGMGYDPDVMRDALYRAVGATLANDGTRSNEDRFWQVFSATSGVGAGELSEVLGDYYKNEFSAVIAATCGRQERSREVLGRVRDGGRTAVLATNPLFPICATHMRMALGGLDPSDFAYITAYENSSYCKPDPRYFEELLCRLGLTPDECVMVGNDTRDDMSAATLGIPVFFLTDCLINTSGVDLSEHPHGSFDELIAFIDSLD